MSFGQEMKDFNAAFKTGADFANHVRSNKLDERKEAETERRNQAVEEETARHNKESEAYYQGFGGSNEKRDIEGMASRARGEKDDGRPVSGTGPLAGMVREEAQRAGVDPDVAVRVAMSEGGLHDPVRQSDYKNPKTGERETSYGPLQLNIGGGLGDKALARGIDPRNPEHARAGVRFALEEAKAGGWGPWHGAKRAGIGQWDGLRPPPRAEGPQDPNQQVAMLPDEEPLAFADGGVLPEPNPNAVAYGPRPSSTFTPSFTPRHVGQTAAGTTWDRTPAPAWSTDMTQATPGQLKLRAPKKAPKPTAAVTPTTNPLLPAPAAGVLPAPAAAVPKPKPRPAATGPVPPTGGPAAPARPGTRPGRPGAPVAPAVAGRTPQQLAAMTDQQLMQIAAENATPNPVGQWGNQGNLQGMQDYARYRLGQGYDQAQVAARRGYNPQVNPNDVRYRGGSDGGDAGTGGLYARGGMVKSYAEGGAVDDEYVGVPVEPEALAYTPVPSTGEEGPGARKSTYDPEDTPEAAKRRLAQRQKEYEGLPKFSPPPDQEKARTTLSTEPPPRPEGGQRTDMRPGAPETGEPREPEGPPVPPPELVPMQRELPPVTGGPPTPEEIARRQAAAGGPPPAPAGVVPEPELVPTPREAIPGVAAGRIVRPAEPGVSAPSGEPQGPPMPPEAMSRETPAVPGTLATPPSADEIARRRAAALEGPGTVLPRGTAAGETEAYLREAIPSAAGAIADRYKENLGKTRVSPEGPTVDQMQAGVIPTPEEHTVERLPVNPPLPPRRPGTGEVTAGDATTPSKAADKRMSADRKNITRVIKGGLKATQDEYTSGQGPVPDPAVARRNAQRLASHADAPSQEDVNQLYERIDPQHKLDAEARMLKGMEDQYDYYLSLGKPDAANRAVASMMAYSRKSAQTLGQLAGSMIEDGDYQGAAQMMTRAYAVIPDGRGLRVEPTKAFGKDGKTDGDLFKYKVIDRTNGETVEEGTVNKDSMLKMAGQLGNGQGWMKQMFEATEGFPSTMAGRGRGGTSVASAQKAALSQAQTTAYNGLVEAARKDPDSEATRQATEAFRRVYGTKSDTSRIIGGAFKEAGAEPPPAFRSGASAAERGEQALTDTNRDFGKRIEAEPDPRKKRALGIEHVSAIADKIKPMTVREQDLDPAIPETVPEEKRAPYKSLMTTLLSKNRGSSPTQAAEFIEAARTIKSPDDVVFTPRGKLAIKGNPVEFFADKLFMDGLRKFGGS